MNSNEIRIQTVFGATLFLLCSLSLPLIGLREKTSGVNLGGQVNEVLDLRPPAKLHALAENFREDLKR